MYSFSFKNVRKRKDCTHIPNTGVLAEQMFYHENDTIAHDVNFWIEYCVTFNQSEIKLTLAVHDPMRYYCDELEMEMDRKVVCPACGQESCSWRKKAYKRCNKNYILALNLKS